MSQFYFPPDTYYGIPTLKDDSAEVAQRFDRLSNVLRQNQAESDQQRMAQMAAERLSQYGEQGAAWGEQIRRDPRAALMIAEQYGGFGEIEAQLAGARAQAASTAAMERAIQADGGAGLSPAELEIFRQGGPDALKKFRDAVNPAADGPTNYTTADGVFIRDPSAPGGYRNVGKPKQSGGMNVYDANGNLIVSTGSMTNSTRSGLEGKMIDADSALARLDGIRGGFDSSFQQWGTKADMAVLKGKAAAGMYLSPEDQSKLEHFATFRVNAFENMNRILHELSGAAISPAEMERLSQALPNPGTGIFDGDDPITFKAKLDAVDRQVRTAVDVYRRKYSQGPASGSGGQRAMPEGVPAGSQWDESGRMWVSPDGRFFAED